MLGGALLTGPATAMAAPAPDPAALEAGLAAVTAHAQQLAADLEQARTQEGALEQAVQDLTQSAAQAGERLDVQVRAAYIAAAPPELAGWTALTDPGGAQLAAEGLGIEGLAGAVRIDRRLVDAVRTSTAQARQLQAQAQELRARLQDEVAAVLADQDRARELLAQAEAAVRAQQAAAQQAAAQAAQAEAARLAATRAALDAVSAAVTDAVGPHPTAAGRWAAAANGPVLALLAAAGAGYPAGYRPTGAVITGTASWYGPGFVGSPTASGAPYDPEQQTCAHRSLPLGTVLHVSANGRSTNCLVTDRGPYVGDRVLDLSRAGSRALGYTGTAEVSAEVLHTSTP